MKNVFVITLGTREVQLDLRKAGKNAKDGIFSSPIGKINYFINSSYPKFGIFKPRDAGKKIDKYFEQLFPYLRYPLIEDALRIYLKKNKPDYKIVLVYTDQEKEFLEGKVKENHYESDSVFFFKIIKKFILKNYNWLHPGDIIPYPIEEKLSDIDYHFNCFDKKVKDMLSISEVELEQIYLLPQGGIDQVNFALTLCLIERFPYKVTQLQKAEGKAISSLGFPNLFMHKIESNQIRKLLLAGDYNGINSISNITEVKNLCEIAHSILLLDVNKLKKIEVKSISIKTCRVLIGLLKSGIITEKLKAKISVTFAACLRAHTNKRYEDFVWRLGAIYEMMCQLYIINIYNLSAFNDIQFYNAVNDDINVIEIISKYTKYKNTANKWVYSTNHNLLFDIVNQYPKSDEKLFTIICQLKPFYKFRNAFLHSADGIDIISLDAELKQRKSKSSQHILNLLLDSEFSLAHKVLLEIDTEIAGSYSGLMK